MEVLPWKLSGRADERSRDYVLDMKMRQHLVVVSGGEWRLRIQKDSGVAEGSVMG
jgi:hypothetical protein